MNGVQILEAYRSRLLAVERVARLTAATYCGEIGLFLRYLDERGTGAENAPAQDAGALAGYLAARAEDGLDPRSRAKALSALRSFYRYCIAAGLRADNPARLLDMPKLPRRLPDAPGADEVDALFAALKSGTPGEARDRALFELVYSCGLRISEALSLDLDDLYAEETLLRVSGKGGKERLVPFGARAGALLDAYLRETRPLLLGRRATNALFLSSRGTRLSRKTAWKHYSDHARAFGKSGKLHGLRHGFATALLRGGADLRSVQELMGHADPATTQIYTHLDPAQLRAAHRRYLPRLGLRGEAGGKAEKRGTDGAAPGTEGLK